MKVKFLKDKDTRCTAFIPMFFAELDKHTEIKSLSIGVEFWHRTAFVMLTWKEYK